MKRKTVVNSVLTTVVAAAIAFSVLTGGKSFYVSPTGSDANAGTLSAPFKTVNKAMASAAAGDTIFLMPGQYPAFNFTKSVSVIGSPNFGSIIKGQVRCYRIDNITLSGVDVFGASGTSTGAVLLDQCNHSTISNSKIHGSAGGTISGIVSRGNNNRILGNEVYENPYVGIRISMGADTEVAYNTVHHHSVYAGDSDCIDIVSNASTRINIHDNVVHDCADDGIDTWTSPGNILTNNISYNNGGTGDGNGFKLGGGSTGGNNIVTGNVAYGNEASGFTSNGNGNYYENNTAYQNGECGFIDSWRNAGGPSTFINNLAYANIKCNFGVDPKFIATYTGNSTNPMGTMTIIPATVTRTPTIIPTSTPRITVTWTPVAIPTFCETTDHFLICTR